MADERPSNPAAGKIVFNPFVIAQRSDVVRVAHDASADLRATIDQLRAELATARETISRLNRRCQSAESGLRDTIEVARRAGPSFGRTLANAAATMYERERQELATVLRGQRALLVRLRDRLEARRREDPACYSCRYQVHTIDCVHVAAVDEIAAAIATIDGVLG